MTDRLQFDGVLIVGAGLGGLSAALACAPRKALVLAGQPLLRGSSSAWAQGGIAAPFMPGDSPELHADDTVAAGAGLVDARRAELMTAEGVAAVERLAQLGVPFDRDAQGALVPSLEAAHAVPRVARVKGDQAGRAIMEAVTAAALAAPHIEVRQGARAVSLLKDQAGRVRGALVDQDGKLTEITAAATILATGGVGGLYAVTTNPRELRGEGLALAALAGARIADPEFVQFHPTALDVGADPAPLASEALRGAGAKLVDRDGHAYMSRFHAKAELAPRDIVARANHRQIVEGKGAFLDAREAIGAAFPEEFPTIFAAAMAAGVDPRVQPMPIAPAEHYHMGGIATDENGLTSLPGLYAVGECASTGVHGANRLASNSLLEAAVFGARAGQAAREAVDPATDTQPATAAPSLPDEAIATLRTAMSRDAGVVRERAGLQHLIGVIDDLQARHGLALPLVAARLIAECALARRESRGGHYRADFPAISAPARRTFVTWKDIEARRAAA